MELFFWHCHTNITFSLYTVINILYLHGKIYISNSHSLSLSLSKLTMLLNKNPYFCPIYGQLKSSFPAEKSSIHNFQNKSQLIKRTFCQVRREKGPLTKSIGISDFFQGKNIFVTGATGLLGKGSYTHHFYCQRTLVFSRGWLLGTNNHDPHCMYKDYSTHFYKCTSNWIKCGSILT